MNWQGVRDLFAIRLRWPQTAGTSHRDHELLRQARAYLEAGDTARALALVIEVLEGPGARPE
jgi:hypothetical protein